MSLGILYTLYIKPIGLLTPRLHTIQVVVADCGGIVLSVDEFPKYSFIFFLSYITNFLMLNKYSFIFLSDKFS